VVAPAGGGWGGLAPWRAKAADAAAAAKNN